MATVIPNPSNSFRLSGGGRRGRTMIPGSNSVRIPTSGQKLTPYINSVDPMSSVVRLGVGGGVPTNNPNSSANFEIALPG